MSPAGPAVKPSRPGPPLVNPGEKTELWMTDARGNAKTVIDGAGK
jgi:hypothetical protein